MFTKIKTLTSQIQGISMQPYNDGTPGLSSETDSGSQTQLRAAGPSQPILPETIFNSINKKMNELTPAQLTKQPNGWKQVKTGRKNNGAESAALHRAPHKMNAESSKQGKPLNAS